MISNADIKYYINLRAKWRNKSKDLSVAPSVLLCTMYYVYQILCMIKIHSDFN